MAQAPGHYAHTHWHSEVDEALFVRALYNSQQQQRIAQRRILTQGGGESKYGRRASQAEVLQTVVNQLSLTTALQRQSHAHENGQQASSELLKNERLAGRLRNEGEEGEGRLLAFPHIAGVAELHLGVRTTERTYLLWKRARYAVRAGEIAEIGERRKLLRFPALDTESFKNAIRGGDLEGLLPADAGAPSQGGGVVIDPPSQAHRLGRSWSARSFGVTRKSLTKTRLFQRGRDERSASPPITPTMADVLVPSGDWAWKRPNPDAPRPVCI